MEQIGPYQIKEMLAAGGMAEIYLGQRTGPGGFEKSLVIKRITKKLLGDRDIEAMFKDEARVQAMLDHANVVQIYDFGEERGAYYIAMEFVAGATLRWVIDNANAVERPIPLEHALRITSDVLAGLHYAHALTDAEGTPLNLIHRDISPVNILVARSGVAKICDFGVAKSQLQSALTQAGHIKGKYRYMSPEQLGALPLDRRADVFSVGVCLWEMLTGERLFGHASDDDVVAAIRSGQYPAPSTRREGMPRAIDRIVRRALAPDPADRFRSARAFQLACEEILRLLPKPSNSVLLGEYICAELDGSAALTPDERPRAEHDSSGRVASGFEMLDPPIPQHPTDIRARSAEEHDGQTAAARSPSVAGRLLSWSLMIPAAAFASAARLLEAMSHLLTKRGQRGVKVTRTSSQR